MGDAADSWDEQGQQAWLDHLTGVCDEWCPYCEDLVNQEFEEEENNNNGETP